MTSRSTLSLVPAEQAVEQPPGDLSRRFQVAGEAIMRALDAFADGEDELVAACLERALGELSAGQAEARRVEDLVAMVAAVTARVADRLSLPGHPPPPGEDDDGRPEA
jgi:hypothetical protein